MRDGVQILALPLTGSDNLKNHPTSLGPVSSSVKQGHEALGEHEGIPPHPEALISIWSQPTSPVSALP